MSKFQQLNLAHEEPLPSPNQLMEDLPSKPHHQQFIEKSRCQIREILDGTDPRLLLIVGPCSIHDITAAKEYATKLRALVTNNFLIVMRVYFEKPRTSVGWKGLLYDPFLDGSNDINAGLRMSRQLLLDLVEMELPAATEFLDIASGYYFSDLISWGCIGARTAASQTHRQIASGLPMPIAFKNNTDGNVDIAVNGIINAATPHTYMGMNGAGQVCLTSTKGNKYCHTALRGGINKPNYDPQSIAHALNLLKSNNVPPRLLIDCSHDNSFRTHEQQPVVFQSVINQIIEGNKNIRGLILESHLYAGNQPLSSDLSLLKYAVSVTDPCLDWTSTEQLILWADEALSREYSNTLYIES